MKCMLLGGPEGALICESRNFDGNMSVRGMQNPIVTGNQRSIARVMNVPIEDVLIAMLSWRNRTVRVGRDALHGDGRISVIPDCDGLITDSPGLVIGANSADCMVLAIYAPASSHNAKRFVCVVHCSWMGLRDGVLINFFDALRRALNVGPSRMRDSDYGSHLHAYIGTSLCKECFAFGRSDFFYQRLDGIYSAFEERRGKVYIDAKKSMMTSLGKFGIPPNQVSVSHECTLCTMDSEGSPVSLSWRRDREKGFNLEDMRSGYTGIKLL